MITLLASAFASIALSTGQAAPMTSLQSFASLPAVAFRLEDPSTAAPITELVNSKRPIQTATVLETKGPRQPLQSPPSIQNPLHAPSAPLNAQQGLIEEKWRAIDKIETRDFFRAHR